MKDRGKRELEAYNNNNGDCFAENIPGFPCKKHPSSFSSSSCSSGGICAYCLTDRLVQLVCPECGEQKLSSCSCSDQGISSDPNSSSTDVGSVGRISFLLENDKNGVEIDKNPVQKHSKNPDFVTLKRSNSTCVDLPKRGGGGGGALWKIGRMFRKKREKKNNHNNDNNNDENKSEMELSECIGVSRSRSLCSFRGFYDTEESGAFAASSAARASNVSGNFVLDSAKRSCFSESEARISNFDCYDPSLVGPNRNIFSLKESEFISCVDDPAFIDLKLHELSSESKPEMMPVLKRGGIGGMSTKEFGFRGGGGGDVLGHHEMFKNGGGSCRISVSERELRKCRKSYKVWRWFFRHQPSSRRKGEDHAFKS